MTKVNGLGNRLYVGGYNLSGDVGMLNRISSSRDMDTITGIDKYGTERVHLLRDGAIDYTVYFNPSAGQAHPVLSTLPTADVHAAYCLGTTLGTPAAAMVARQVDYALKRSDKGMLTFDVTALANGYGLEWGEQLTAGLRSDAPTDIGTTPYTFESGAGGFDATDCTFTQSDEQAYVGTYSGKMVVTGTPSAAYVRPTAATGIAVTPGEEYTVQFWAYSADGHDTLGVAIDWLDAGRGYLSSDVANVTIGAASWVYQTHAAVAPAGAAYAIYGPTLGNSPGTGETLYIDQLQLTHSGAAAGPGVDFTAGQSYGLQAYLQVTAMTGTDVVVKLQHSDDDGSIDPYSDITGGAFTAVTSAPASERIQTAGDGAVKRWVRAVTTTSGTFTATFHVMVVVNRVEVDI